MAIRRFFASLCSGGAPAAEVKPTKDTVVRVAIAPPPAEIAAPKRAAAVVSSVNSEKQTAKTLRPSARYTTATVGSLPSGGSVASAASSDVSSSSLLQRSMVILPGVLEEPAHPPIAHISIPPLVIALPDVDAVTPPTPIRPPSNSDDEDSPPVGQLWRLNRFRQHSSLVPPDDSFPVDARPVGAGINPRCRYFTFSKEHAKKSFERTAVTAATAREREELEITCLGSSNIDDVELPSKETLRSRLS